MSKLREELNEIIIQILADEELGRKKFEGWTMESGEPDKGIQEDWHWISHFFADTDDRQKDETLNLYFRDQLQRILES